MIECKGTYFIKDGHLFPVGMVEVLTTDAILIYEVTRVIDGVCLFLGDHYKRLLNSAKLAGVPLKMTEGEFAVEIQALIQAYKMPNGNIKILVQYGNSQQGAFFYFIPHVYPTADNYRHKNSEQTNIIKPTSWSILNCGRITCQFGPIRL